MYFNFGFYILLDVINNEQKLLCANSDEICHKRFFDKEIENYKKVSIFSYQIYLLVINVVK